MAGRKGTEQFINKRFSKVYQGVLNDVLVVLDDYARQGYDLSLRQLYYQLVARDLFPAEWISKTTGSKNCMENYKRLVTLVGDGRLAGIIPWTAIEDRNRSTSRASTWSTPEDIMDSAIQSYREDLWQDQPYYVHAMVEKDALSGILEPVCRRFGIPFTANKGYSSLSMLYWTAKSFVRQRRNGKNVLVLYFGDHDPSGIDMTRDIEDRLQTFAGGQIEVKRLALNMDQVELYNPPENPAKETDSRFQEYLSNFGESSWELDAIEPSVLDQLLTSNIEGVIDWDTWNQAKKAQETNRAKLKWAKEHLEDFEPEEEDEDSAGEGSEMEEEG